MQKPFFYIFLFTCLLPACKKDIGFIEPELAEYVDRFFLEAEKRGLQLDADNLQAVLLPEVVADDIRLCGQGLSPIFGDNIRRVEISQTCWNFATEIEKEILVFHELGHVILEQFHNSAKLPNGRNKSIMFSGEFCDVYASYSECQVDLRAYYLDELFDVVSNNPFWSFRQNIRRTFFAEGFDEPVVRWASSSSDTTHFSYNQDSTTFHSAPSSLALHQHTTDNIGATSLIKKVVLSPIKLCSNLHVSFYAKTENLGTGRFDMELSYPSFDENENIVATCQHPFSIRETDTFKKFSFDLFCIPGGRKEFEIRLTLHAPTPATVYVDDLELVLWD